MNFSKYFDHTLLKQNATEEQIIKVCEEAKQYDFASVCVNTVWLPVVAKCLANTDVKPCVVVGFPLGAAATESKAFETKWAVENGAEEIDTVLPAGLFTAGDFAGTEKDIKAVVEAANGKTVKVILETCLLTDEQKIDASKLVVNCGANFVKTSTGFSTGGATAHDVALMRKAVGPDFGVKASGGIRDLKTALEMIDAGASRLGVSASVNIMKEYLSRN